MSEDKVNTRMYIQMAPQVKHSGVGGAVFGAPASPGKVGGGDTSNGSFESRVARIQALRGQAGGNAQISTSGVGDANAQKANLGSDKNQIGSTVEYLTNASATIDGLIPQSEKFIAACEEELKKATAKCDMKGIAEHTKMLAEKKVAHAELLARQAQVNAAKSVEQDKLGSTESELGNANSTIPRLQADEQKAYAQVGDFDAKLSELSSSANSKGTGNGSNLGNFEQLSNPSNNLFVANGSQTNRVAQLGGSTGSQSGQLGQHKNAA